MMTIITSEDETLMVFPKGTMVISIPVEEDEYQLHHLDQLEPVDDESYNEISSLYDIVLKKKPKPKLTIIKGGKNEVPDTA